MVTDRFNIRVYGLLIDEGRVLLVHERIGDFEFTKFPGGGLELGEGTRDCLVREFMEETGIAVSTGRHLYTTDFFQVSAFKSTDQIISVYYEVKPLTSPFEVPVEEIRVIENGREEFLKFFWVPLDALHSDLVTFPIDKLVIKKLLQGEL